MMNGGGKTTKPRKQSQAGLQIHSIIERPTNIKKLGSLMRPAITPEVNSKKIRKLIELI